MKNFNEKSSPCFFSDISFIEIISVNIDFLVAMVSSQPFWETIEVPSDPKMDMNIYTTDYYKYLDTIHFCVWLI